MDAVTYPDIAVAEYMTDHFVCFRTEIEASKDLARELGAAWTPGLVWLDETGTPHHRQVGYFSPEELLAECAFARGMVAVGKRDWADAAACFATVTDEWPRSFAAPAARYWRGAASTGAAHDPKELLAHWNRLLEDHPDSAWAMKVAFIRDEA